MTRMRTRLSTALLLLAVQAATADALTVSAEFFGGVDFTGYRSYSWREGTPAPNFETEMQIRNAIDGRLEKKGFKKVTGEADLYIVSHAVRDQLFFLGLLRIDVFDARTEKLVWRGNASEVATADPKRRRKSINKGVKELFKQFPSARKR